MDTTCKNELSALREELSGLQLTGRKAEQAALQETIESLRISLAALSDSIADSASDSCIDLLEEAGDALYFISECLSTPAGAKALSLQEELADICALLQEAADA